MTKHAGRTLTVDFEGQTLGQLHSFSEFGSTRSLIPASVYGEDDMDYVLGLKDGTEVTGQVLYDPADTGFAAMEASYNDDPDAVVTFEATHVASGVTFFINHKLTKIAYESPLDGLFAANFTAKIVSPGVVLAS